MTHVHILGAIFVAVLAAGIFLALEPSAWLAGYVAVSAGLSYALGSWAGTHFFGEDRESLEPTLKSAAGNGSPSGDAGCGVTRLEAAGVDGRQWQDLCAGSRDWHDSAMPLTKPPIAVDAGAWLCAEVFAGPGAAVGAGAVLGARAVVLKNVAPAAIMAGNPARQIGTRGGSLGVGVTVAILTLNEARRIERAPRSRAGFADSGWVFRRDADGILSDALAQDIAGRLTGMANDVAGLTVAQRISSLGRPIRHGGALPAYERGADDGLELSEGRNPIADVAGGTPVGLLSCP